MLQVASTTGASDEAIASVLKLTTSALCYGELRDLQLHMHAVHKIVKEKGGLSMLGMDGILGKIVAM